MSIKLVVSDMDGTLLPEGTNQLNPEYYDVILKLKEKGIVFAAASGRQFHSIEGMFEPIKNDIYFVAQNGSYIHYQGKDVYAKNMDQAKAWELARQLLEIPGGEVLVNNNRMMYTHSKNEEFLHLLRYGYRNAITEVEDILRVDAQLNMVTLYLEEGIDQIGAKMQAQWGDVFTCTLAGAKWLDFMDKSANKGNALLALQKTLGILPEETMAFGDGMNDIAMLKVAGESYAMASARDEVKDAAKYVLGNEHEHSVLMELYKLL